jgi:hypothetical protein
MHITAWAYTQPSYADMQFIKFEIINKNTLPWYNTYFSIISDPDLGEPMNDYIGCDTIRKMGYVYNAVNYDPIYGSNPPAAGFVFLQSARNNYSVPPFYLGLTAFNFFTDMASNPAPCESDPGGEPYGAYLFMKGFKKDSTRWMDVSQTPYKKTFFNYYGDPETNIGWTEYKGKMNNCGGDTIAQVVIPVPPGDRRLIMSTGAENLTVQPGDTQKIYVTQLIAQGTSNLNSVTKLKQLADVAINFFNSGFVIGVNPISTEVPSEFYLLQNYPNPFNPVTQIKFDVSKQGLTKLVIFDVLGREVTTLVNEMKSPGSYIVDFNASKLASGVYFYKLETGSFTDVKKMMLIK